MTADAAFTGRKRPYTEIGIRRLACTRCAEPARYQWQCCANDNRWLPLCAACDIELNRVAMDFMRVANAEALLVRYAKEARADG